MAKWTVRRWVKQITAAVLKKECAFLKSTTFWGKKSEKILVFETGYFPFVLRTLAASFAYFSPIFVSRVKKSSVYEVKRGEKSRFLLRLWEEGSGKLEAHVPWNNLGHCLYYTHCLTDRGVKRRRKKEPLKLNQIRSVCKDIFEKPKTEKARPSALNYVTNQLMVPSSRKVRIRQVSFC